MLAYKEALEQDFQLVTSMVLPATAKAVKQQAQGYMEKCTRAYINRKLTHFIEQNPKLEVLGSEDP